MSAYKKDHKKNKYWGLFTILFLVASLWVGLISIRQQQNLGGKAAGNCANPGSIVQCPRSDGALVSCNPPDSNGNAQISLCNSKGRVEMCNGVNYCCPAVNGSWTRTMTACNTPIPTPIPTKSPTPIPTPSPTLIPTLSPSPSPSPSPTPTKSPSPSPLSCVNPNINSNPWNVDQLGTVNIIDVGLIIDNYGKDRCLNPKTDVNNDGSIDIIDIGIVLDHYSF